MSSQEQEHLIRLYELLAIFRCGGIANTLFLPGVEL